MGEIRVISPGPFTTVQDLGRPGLGHLGVPIGGAADTRSLRIANRLVSNPDSAAAFEMTLAGAELAFSHTGLVAMVGGHAELALLSDAAGPRPVSMGSAIPVATSERLRVGPITRGVRAYLAISGGLDTPDTLGSRSTHARAGFGGFHGRPLRANDILRWHGRSPRAMPPDTSETFAAESSRTPGGTLELRAVDSIHAVMFHSDASAAFWKQGFAVSPSSDRAGVRLCGGAVASSGGRLPSEGLMPGAVQIPPDGQPIVLGVDHPTTGGYPVIACVIGADLPMVAQLCPGDVVRFRRVTLDEARRLWQESERTIDELIAPVNTSP